MCYNLLRSNPISIHCHQLLRLESTMTPFLLKRVENPTEAQIDTCSTLFYDLMRTNQATIALVGGDAALLKLQAAATIPAGALAGEFYVAENHDGDIVAYTLWMPPGEEIFSSLYESPEQCALGLNNFMESLFEAAKEYFRTTYHDLAEFPAFVNSILGPTGKINSWWLNMAMVHPEASANRLKSSRVLPLLSPQDVKSAHNAR
ncbi:hypothetical protein D9619_013512 [Psilocybe cf. subviscida]|uniref:Uncharacterized protein n=1 Tax=Psilocybe cf. subviscida TaxID=2480587 RepID=A0A8H5F4F8_9AGAR|nr:hypothetical protein D9619_013512 [Psilocybe cf. subviscida]